MEIGQRFYMSHKNSPDPRLFEYHGRDDNHFDQSSNHVVVEVATGEVSHVELQPWLEQRKIRLEMKGEC